MAASDKRSFYDLLGVPRTATAQEIKKAYHRLCLQLHPDKNPAEDRQAVYDKFQSLQRVYGVLGDEDKRKVYDETGDEGDLSGEQFDKLYRFYREVFAKVTVDDIESHERLYRGSDEEARDLKGFYTRFQGDMEQVFCWLCCSRVDLDSHRFMESLKAAIDAGELKRYSKFEQWAKAVAKRPAPRDALVWCATSSRKGPPTDAMTRWSSAGAHRAAPPSGQDTQALVAAIRGRAQHTANFVDALEAKYGGGGPRQSKRPTQHAEDGSGSPKKPNKRGGSSKKT